MNLENNQYAIVKESFTIGGIGDIIYLSFISLTCTIKSRDIFQLNETNQKILIKHIGYNNNDSLPYGGITSDNFENCYLEIKHCKEPLKSGDVIYKLVNK